MQPNALQHENLHAISENIFDVSQWRERCQKIATDAGNNCGQSHGLYVQRISEMVNFALKEVAEENREEALCVAREFDYASDSELDEDRKWNANNGYCSHGIQLGCCPAGCGSGPDD